MEMNKCKNKNAKETCLRAISIDIVNIVEINMLRGLRMG